MESQKRLFYPDSTTDSLEWVELAPTEPEKSFREFAIVCNMMSRSQIGRAAFRVEETENGESLVIAPPLKAGELRTLSTIPFFRSILERAINE